LQAVSLGKNTPVSQACIADLTQWVKSPINSFTSSKEKGTILRANREKLTPSCIPSITTPLAEGRSEVVLDTKWQAVVYKAIWVEGLN